MQAVCETVTPAIAREWLSHNRVNRVLRKTYVALYRRMFADGEFRLTHQGIAFSESGDLIDGQHRLTAISQMPETFSAQLLVVRGLPQQSFDAIDQGLRRSPGDILNIAPGLAAVLRQIVILAGYKASTISAPLMERFIEPTRASYELLLTSCRGPCKTFGRADVRTAAIVQLMGGSDSDYVCLTYRALNMLEFDYLSPAAQSFYRQVAQSSTTRIERNDGMLLRAFKVFDSREQKVSKIQIKEPEAIRTKMRRIIEAQFGVFLEPDEPINRPDRAIATTVGLLHA